MSFRLIRYLPTLLVLFSSCAVIEPKKGFNEVQGEMTRRTGSSLQWYSTPEEEKEVSQHVDALLKEDLTPERAVMVALLNNRKLQGTYQALGVAQADLVQAGLLRNPTLDGGVLFAGGVSSVEFAVVQNFLSILQLPMRKQIAAAEFEATKLEVLREALRIAASVRLAVIEYQAQEQLLEIDSTALGAFRAARELARRMFQAGNINVLERAQHEAAYAQQSVRVIEEREEVVRRREELNALLGITEPAIDWKMKPRLPQVPSQRVSVTTSRQRVLANNVDLAILSQRISAHRLALGLTEQFRFVESVDGGVGFEREQGDSSEGGTLFGLTIPIFDQGQARVARIRAELEAEQQNFIQARVELEARLRTLTKNQEQARQRVLTYSAELLPLQHTVTEESQKQYNAMLIGVFQLIESKRAQLAIAREYVHALRDFWRETVELQALESGYQFRGV